MSKANKDVPELTDEELAFEMIEITCEEMNSLAKAFEKIALVCKELNGETVEEDHGEENGDLPEGAEIH